MPSQTISLGTQPFGPSSNSDWTGAVLLDPALVQGGGPAYLRLITLLIGGAALRVQLSATETGAPADTGPQFHPDLVVADAAFTFSEAGGTSITLKGPGHPDNEVVDASEPYAWQPDNWIAWQQWATHLSAGEVTLRITRPALAVLPTAADVPSGHTHSQFAGAVSELRAYDRALAPEEVLHNYHVRDRPLIGTFHIDEAHALPGMGNGELERFAGAFVAFLNGLLTQRGTVAEYDAWKTIKGFTVWDPDALQLYVSDGTAFQEVYGIADLAPGIPSLRTLGDGAQQMSPGNHADNGGHPLSDLSVAVNPAPNVGGLRTLYNPSSPAPGDDGSQSAAAGNHGH